MEWGPVQHLLCRVTAVSGVATCRLLAPILLFKCPKKTHIPNNVYGREMCSAMWCDKQINSQQRGFEIATVTDTNSEYAE
jgi:hypothetical protein